MFSSLRDGGPAELPAVLCSPVILKPPSALTHTVGTMPWAPMWPTVTGTLLLSKGPILETIFWVCLFICFFCPPCWEWWQGSFLVDIVNSALKVTFPTEKQLFRVWIFKRISPKKKWVYFLKGHTFEFRLRYLWLSESYFHKEHDVVKCLKKKITLALFCRGKREYRFLVGWNI